MILTLTFVALAAACNAVMDICSHKWYTSIFSNYSRQWWDATVSWRNKYNSLSPANGRRKIFWQINFPVQLTDSWHLFKTLMIIFLCIAIALPTSHNLLTFALAGITWNTTFSLFYKLILIKR
jgi:hypothetical protein